MGAVGEAEGEPDEPLVVLAEVVTVSTPVEVSGAVTVMVGKGDCVAVAVARDDAEGAGDAVPVELAGVETEAPPLGVPGGVLLAEMVAVAEVEEVIELDAQPEGNAEPVAVPQLLAAPLLLEVPSPDADALAVSEPEAQVVAEGTPTLTVEEAVAARAGLGEADNVAPDEGVTETLPLPMGPAVKEPPPMSLLGLRVPLAQTLPLALQGLLGEAGMEAVKVTEGEPLAVAPMLGVSGEVGDALLEVEATPPVGEAVALPLPPPLLLAEVASEKEVNGDEVETDEGLPLTVPPKAREEEGSSMVGEGVALLGALPEGRSADVVGVALPSVLLEASNEGVQVVEVVEQDDGVAELVPDAGPLLTEGAAGDEDAVTVPLACADALAAAVVESMPLKEAAAELHAEELGSAVLLPLPPASPGALPLPAGEAVPETLTDPEEKPLPLPVMVPLSLPHPALMLPTALAVASGDTDAQTEDEVELSSVALASGDTDAPLLLERSAEGEVDGVGEREEVPESLPCSRAWSPLLRVPAAERVARIAGDAEGIVDTEVQGEAEGGRDGEGEALKQAPALAESRGLRDAAMELLMQALALPHRVGSEQGVALDEAALETDTEGESAAEPVGAPSLGEGAGVSLLDLEVVLDAQVLRLCAGEREVDPEAQAAVEAEAQDEGVVGGVAVVQGVGLGTGERVASAGVVVGGLEPVPLLEPEPPKPLSVAVAHTVTVPDGQEEGVKIPPVEEAVIVFPPPPLPETDAVEQG